MKRIDNIYDHNMFLIFRCEECKGELDINPSDLVTVGVPICECDREMEYNGVYLVSREDEDSLCMTELANDPDYQKWCDDRSQACVNEIDIMNDEDIEANFGISKADL